jgi:hypothetical protein
MNCDTRQRRCTLIAGKRGNIQGLCCGRATKMFTSSTASAVFYGWSYGKDLALSCRMVEGAYSSNYVLCGLEQSLKLHLWLLQATANLARGLTHRLGSRVKSSWGDERCVLRTKGALISKCPIRGVLKKMS